MLASNALETLEKEMYEVHSDSNGKEISLICNSPAIGKETDIRVYDLHGDLISVLHVNRKPVIRLGGNLPPGLYFISVSSEDVHQVLKIVKK